MKLKLTISFFFFYGGSLMDVASQTAWRNSPLSSACLPASTVETPIHSPMSCFHLLLGLPLPLLPSHVPSKNSFSNVLCRFMWPKYDSFCFLIRFKSCGAFTPSCSRTLAFVLLSVHEILSNNKLLILKNSATALIKKIKQGEILRTAILSDSRSHLLSKIFL